MAKHKGQNRYNREQGIKVRAVAETGGVVFIKTFDEALKADFV